MSLISLFPTSLTAGSVLNAQWRLQMNVAVINHFICPMKMVFFLFRYCSLLCYGKYSLFPASSRVITFTHTHIGKKTNQQPFFDIIAAWVYVIILYDQVKKKFTLCETWIEFLLYTWKLFAGEIDMKSNYCLSCRLNFYFQ